jgi:hypothetical protein
MHVLGGAEFAPWMTTLPGCLVVWDMNDPVGSSVLTARPDTAYNGSNTGITMGQATGTPLKYGGTFDGANDYGTLHTASLQANWNADLMTMVVLFKVSGVGVWTDGTLRSIFRIGVDFNNQVFLYRAGPANQVTWLYKAGGTSEIITKAGLSSTDYLMMAITADKAGVGASFWWNGVQEGASQAIAGVWAGALTSAWTALGSADGTVASNVWDGDIALAAVYSEDLSDYMAEIYARSGI